MTTSLSKLRSNIPTGETGKNCKIPLTAFGWTIPNEWLFWILRGFWCSNIFIWVLWTEKMDPSEDVAEFLNLRHPLNKISGALRISVLRSLLKVFRFALVSEVTLSFQLEFLTDSWNYLFYTNLWLRSFLKTFLKAKKSCITLR